MNTLKASQILDQVIESNSYSQKLLIDLQHIHRTKKIGSYEYNRMINILSCQMLLIDDVKASITRFISEETAKKLRFDARV